MDEREWKDDKLVVEIQARGQGIIPKLEELFDCKREGFDLETVDGNLSLYPVCQRRQDTRAAGRPQLAADLSPEA